MFKSIQKIVALTVICSLVLEQSGFAQVAPQMNVPAYLSGLVSPEVFRPVHLRSMTIDAATRNIDLLLDKGNARDPKDSEIKETTRQLLNYFQIGLRLPNNTFWVNLRPDSDKDILDPALERTEVGRILLEADLQLKKDMAGFTSPRTSQGKMYWNKLYAKAESLFGRQAVTVPTLTRPWIVPGEVLIKQSTDSAYVYKATLKVMLEQDYIKDSPFFNFVDPRLKELNVYSSDLIRKLILPQLTREINSARRYAALRQVYYSLVLAQWFKKQYKGKDSLYAPLIDKRDLSGLTSPKAWSKADYYKGYQQSFRQGEYDIQESSNDGQGLIIRRYFSGGVSTAIPDTSFHSVTGVNAAAPADPDLVSARLQPDSETLNPDGGRNSISVALSMGGTKLAAGTITRAGEVSSQPDEIQWETRLGVTGKNARTEDIVEAIVDQIEAALRKEGLKASAVQKVGIAFAGPVDSKTGIVGTPFAAPNLPFDHYPLKDVLEKRLNRKYNRTIAVEIENDGTAALRGELSPLGGLHQWRSGMIFILGTGINGAAAIDGKPYSGAQGEIIELGHNIVPTSLAPPALVPAGYKGAFLFVGRETKGDHPKDTQGNPVVGDFEDLLSGPHLDAKFAEHGYTLKSITRLAALKDAKATGLIQETGEQIGQALAAFIWAYQKEAFVRHIVLVSGVAENLGKGVVNAVGQDLFIFSVRQGALDELMRMGMFRQEAGDIVAGIERSQLDSRRELMAFTPDGGKLDPAVEVEMDGLYDILRSRLKDPPPMSVAGGVSDGYQSPAYIDSLQETAQEVFLNRQEYDTFMNYLDGKIEAARAQNQKNKKLTFIPAGIAAIVAAAVMPGLILGLAAGVVAFTVVFAAGIMLLGAPHVPMADVYSKMAVAGTRNTLRFKGDVKPLLPGNVRLHNGFQAPSLLTRRVWFKLKELAKNRLFALNALVTEARFPGTADLFGLGEDFIEDELLAKDGSFDPLVRAVILASVNGNGAFELLVNDPRAGLDGGAESGAGTDTQALRRDVKEMVKAYYLRMFGRFNGQGLIIDDDDVIPLARNIVLQERLRSVRTEPAAAPAPQQSGLSRAAKVALALGVIVSGIMFKNVLEHFQEFQTADLERALHLLGESPFPAASADSTAAAGAAAASVVIFSGHDPYDAETDFLEDRQTGLVDEAILALGESSDAHTLDTLYRVARINPVDDENSRYRNFVPSFFASLSMAKRNNSYGMEELSKYVTNPDPYNDSRFVYKRAALAELIRHPDAPETARALDWILEQPEQWNEQLRVLKFEAAVALAQKRDSRGIAYLEKIVSDDDQLTYYGQAFRIKAVEVLSESDDPLARRCIEARLSEKPEFFSPDYFDSSLDIAAAHGRIRAGDPSGVAFLEEHSTASSRDEQNQIIEALGDARGDVQAQEILVSLWEKSHQPPPFFSLDPFYSLDLPIAVALAKTGDARGIAFLQQLFTSGSPFESDSYADVVRHVGEMKMVGQMREPALAEALYVYLTDDEHFANPYFLADANPYFELRVETARALGLSGDRTHLEEMNRLVAGALQRQDYATVSAFSPALGLLGNEESASLLRSALEQMQDQGYEKKKFIIAEALSDMGDPAGDEYLVRYLNDEYLAHPNSLGLGSEIAFGAVAAAAAAVALAKSRKGSAEGDQAEQAVGGIDFRAVPVNVAPAAPAGSIAAAVDPAWLSVSLPELDRRWLEIQASLAQGPVPFAKIKEFIAICSSRKDAGDRLKAVSAWVAAILKMEEAAALETAPELVEIIAVL
ncbi:MAG TPA: ROK family protein [Candidatus Omnitrophota bacterium]|nr:ROK family protein [Candidatus Omnitrophota bacterium]